MLMMNRRKAKGRGWRGERRGGGGRGGRGGRERNRREEESAAADPEAARDLAMTHAAAADLVPDGANFAQKLTEVVARTLAASFGVPKRRGRPSSAATAGARAAGSGGRCL